MFSFVIKQSQINYQLGHIINVRKVLSKRENNFTEVKRFLHSFV